MESNDKGGCWKTCLAVIAAFLLLLAIGYAVISNWDNISKHPVAGFIGRFWDGVVQPFKQPTLLPYPPAAWGPACPKGWPDEEIYMVEQAGVDRQGRKLYNAHARAKGKITIYRSIPGSCLKDKWQGSPLP